MYRESYKLGVLKIGYYLEWLKQPPALMVVKEKNNRKKKPYVYTRIY